MNLDLVPDDQSHLLITGNTLHQLISNASTNDKIYIYYDSGIKQPTIMHHHNQNSEFNSEEMDVGYAMINMTML